MTQKINEPVSVSLSFDSITKKVQPKGIVWKGKLYTITKVGLHHVYRQGRDLFHVFSVATPTLFFRLLLDANTLHWELEEISDGLSN